VRCVPLLQVLIELAEYVQPGRGIGREIAQRLSREGASDATKHPVIASAEPGERWLYCYPDDAFAEF
jgi:hypothetical protein